MSTRRRAVSTIVAALLITAAFAIILVGLNAVFQRQLLYQQTMHEYLHEQQVRRTESLSLEALTYDNGTYYLTIRNDSPFTSKILRMYYYNSTDMGWRWINVTIPPASSKTIGLSIGYWSHVTFKAVTALGNLFVFRKITVGPPTYTGLIWGGDIYEVRGSSLTPIKRGRILYDDFESYEVGSDIDGQGRWHRFTDAPATIISIDGNRYLSMNGTRTVDCLVEGVGERSTRIVVLVVGAMPLAKDTERGFEFGFEATNETENRNPMEGYAGRAEKSRSKLVRYDDHGVVVLAEGDGGYKLHKYYVLKLVRRGDGDLRLYKNGTYVVGASDTKYGTLSYISLFVDRRNKWAVDYVSAYVGENVTVRAPVGSIATLSGKDVEGKGVHITATDNREGDIDPRPGYISLNISSYYSPINGTITVTLPSTTTPPPSPGELVLVPGSVSEATYVQRGPRDLEIYLGDPIALWSEGFEHYSYAKTRRSNTAFGTINHWWTIERKRTSSSKAAYYDAWAKVVSSGLGDGAEVGSAALEQYIHYGDDWVRAVYEFASDMNPDAMPIPQGTMISGAIYPESFSSYSVASVHLLISSSGDTQPSHELILYWTSRSSYRPPARTPGASIAYRWMGRLNRGDWTSFSVDWSSLAGGLDWSHGPPPTGSKVTGIVLQVYNENSATTKVLWDNLRAVRIYGDLFGVLNEGSQPLDANVSVIGERWWLAHTNYPLEIYLDNETGLVACYNYTPSLGWRTVDVHLKANSPRVMELEGSFSFFTRSTTTFTVGHDAYTVPDGSRVEITVEKFNSSSGHSGKIYVNTEGDIAIQDLPVTNVTIDGVEIIGSSPAVLDVQGRLDVDRGITSRLTVRLPGTHTGYTELVVGGGTEISGNTDEAIEVYSPVVTPDEGLTVDVGDMELRARVLGVRWDAGSEGFVKSYMTGTLRVYGGQTIRMSATISSPGLEAWGPESNRTIRVRIAAVSDSNTYTGYVTIHLPGPGSAVGVRVTEEPDIVGTPYSPILEGWNEKRTVIRLKTLQNWVQDFECCDPTRDSSRNYYWKLYRSFLGSHYWSYIHPYNGTHTYMDAVYGPSFLQGYIVSYFDFDSKHDNPSFYNGDEAFLVARGNASLLHGSFYTYWLGEPDAGARIELHVVYYPEWPSSEKRELILYWHHDGGGSPSWYESRDYRIVDMGSVEGGRRYTFSVDWLKLAAEKWGDAGSNPRVRRIYLSLEVPKGDEGIGPPPHPIPRRIVRIPWDTIYMAQNVSGLLIDNPTSSNFKVKLLLAKLDGGAISNGSTDDIYKRIVLLRTYLNGSEQASYEFQPSHTRSIIVRQPSSPIDLPSGAKLYLSLLVTTSPPPKNAGYGGNQYDENAELYREEPVMLILKMYNEHGEFVGEKQILLLVPYLTLKSALATGRS